MHPVLPEYDPCPLAFAPPFSAPRERSMPRDVRRRLLGWCEQAFPGESVSLAEWVGADSRRPVHAVVVSFATGERAPIEVFLKSEDVQPHHLAVLD